MHNSRQSSAPEKDATRWGFVFSLTLSHLCTVDFLHNVCSYVNDLEIKRWMSVFLVKFGRIVDIGG